MYKILGITQSKLRTYGNGNHFNYLGAGIFISNKSLHPKPSFEPIKFNFTYLKLNGLFRKRLSLNEILLRNKEEKRRKKNESSRRSYNKLHKSVKKRTDRKTNKSS
jgi:hypothetical protein